MQHNTKSRYSLLINYLKKLYLVDFLQELPPFYLAPRTFVRKSPSAQIGKMFR